MERSLKLIEPWEVTRNLGIQATPSEVFYFVSTVRNVRHWSPECVNTESVNPQKPETENNTFYGFNRDSHSEWTTACVVNKSQPNTQFEYSVVNFQAGHETDFKTDKYKIEPGELVWGFTIEPREHHTVLHQYMKLRSVSPFFQELLETTEDPQLSLRERKSYVGTMIETSLDAIRKQLET